MKLFFAYLKSKRETLIMLAVFAAVFAGSFLLYRLPLSAVLYPAVLCAILGAVFAVCGFIRAKKKHEILTRLRDMTAAVIDELPKPGSIAENGYGELVSRLCEQNAEIRAADSAKYRDMTEYYTVWAHQIKTPIASMRLTLQNEDSPLSRRLSSDLFRIEQYVEMVLAFLRLDSDSSDYVFRQYALDGIIRQCVRRFAQEFIGRKIRLVYEPADTEIVTDEKWLCFVIEQVLSNALKYTREGSIHIYMKEPFVLCIEDTGIGIAPEDIPRIFEMGYTGCNGRTDKSASGIGLYLCRRVCKNLGAEISVQSEPGKGTAVSIDLTQHKITHE